MTLPEKMLWKELRALGLNVRRQAPIGRYIADFACHSARLVIELDGSRHDLEAAQLHDLERTAWLRSQGYAVMRFANERVLGDVWGVADDIAEAVRSSKALPLDGGGLGGGVAAATPIDPRSAPTVVLPPAAAASPPSPALPPSRGKGE
jgi:very-short-patch-repair endonuclease